MSRRRRRFSGDFASRASLEAIERQQVLAELAGAYEVHPNLIGAHHKRAAAPSLRWPDLCEVVRPAPPPWRTTINGREGDAARSAAASE